MALKILNSSSKKLYVVFAIIMVISSSYETETFDNIHKVENNLLLKLGIKNRPQQVNGRKVHIPKAMISLYEKQINHEFPSTSLPLPGKLTWIANTIRSYTHQETDIDNRFTYDHQFRLYFNLSAFPETETIVSTELKLNIIPKDSAFTSSQRVNVYDIVQPGVKGQAKPILRLVDTQVVNPVEDTSISLDVLPIIQRCLSDPTDNHGLLISVRSASGLKVQSSHIRLRRTIHDDEASWEAVQPLLFLYSADSKVQETSTSVINGNNLNRRKRNEQHANMKKRVRRGECCRHALWVDFEKVGWNDWIVAPPGYEAYYCAGNCPSQLPDQLNTTNHAIVQSLVHTVHPQAIAKPCCVPTSLSSISMLYLDEHNKAVLKNYPDMVVEGCGCR